MKVPTRIRVAVVVAATALLLSPFGTNGAVGSPPQVGAAHRHTFAAISFDGSAKLYDATTGQAIRRLLPGRQGRFLLYDFGRYRRSKLLATYDRGSHCINGHQYCSNGKTACGGRIISLNPMSGKIWNLWRVGPKRDVLGATASPDGTEVAALVERCQPDAYMSAFLLIRRLSDGKTWSIGRGLAQCHSLSTPTWIDDDRSLVVSYGPSIEGRARSYSTGAGTVGCSVPRRSRLVTIPSDQSQRGVVGSVRKPPRHCDLSTPVIGGGKAFDLESCVAQHSQGPTYVERLNGSLQPVHKWRLSSCDDGADLAVSDTGRLLASSYDFCNPPLPGHKLGDPISHLSRLEHGRLVRIATAKGGNLAWDDMAW